MKVSLKINGEDVRMDVPPNETLVDTLRERLGLTGTKDVCRSGDCGACTVLLNGRPVPSCLILTVEANGSEILTIEGLERDGKLHPLQEAFLEEDAVHCGYCTPGMIVTAYAFLKKDVKPKETMEIIKGNLCRCGTYYNVIKAILKASRLISKAQHK